MSQTPLNKDPRSVQVVKYKAALGKSYVDPSLFSKISSPEVGKDQGTDLGTDISVIKSRIADYDSSEERITRLEQEVKELKQGMITVRRERDQADRFSVIHQHLLVAIWNEYLMMSAAASTFDAALQHDEKQLESLHKSLIEMCTSNTKRTPLYLLSVLRDQASNVRHENANARFRAYSFAHATMIGQKAIGTPHKPFKEYGPNEHATQSVQLDDLFKTAGDTDVLYTLLLDKYPDLKDAHSTYAQFQEYEDEIEAIKQELEEAERDNTAHNEDVSLFGEGKSTSSSRKE